MAEEENLRRKGGFFELGGFVGEDFAARAVFLRSFESMSILELCRMKRKGDDGLAAEGRVGRKRQKVTLWFPEKGFGAARRTATSCSESTAMTAA